MSKGVIYDLGYSPYEGPRLGTASALRVTVTDSIRRVMGMRRRARKKIIPWLIVSLAVVPTIVFLGLEFLLGDFESPLRGTQTETYRNSFGFGSTLVLLFTAFAAPELLIPDREEGVLAVYSSRPLRAWDYLAARVIGLAAVLSFLLLVPQILMYVGFAALRSDSFASAAINNADHLPQIFLTTIVYIVGYGAPALFIATLAKRIGPAAAIYLGAMFATEELVIAVVEGGSQLGKILALISLREHPSVVRDWIFNHEGNDHVMSIAGWSPWISLLAIGVVAVLATLAALQRYRSEI